MSTLALTFLCGTGAGMTLMTILYAFGEHLRRQDEHRVRFQPSLEGWCDDNGHLDAPSQMDLSL